MLRNYLNLPRAVYFLCLGTLINRAGTLMITFLAMYLQKERGLGTEFATRAMGVFGLGAILATFIGGHLADRVGRRFVMALSLFAASGVLCLFGFLRSPWAILGGVAAFALFGEMYRPAMQAMVADLVEPTRRPHAFALIYVAINLGFSVAAGLGGMLAMHNFQLLFWVDALTCSLFGIVTLIGLRETLGKRTPVSAATNDADAAQPQPEEEHIGLWKAYGHVLRDGTFLLFCAGVMMVSLVFMQALSTFPLFMMNEHDIAQDGYGRIIMLNGILIVALQLPAATLLNRFNRVSVMAMAAVLVAVGFGANALASTIWQFAGTVVIWTLGEIMQAAFMATIVTDLAPVRMRARYLGVSSMAFLSATMIGAPIGGLIMNRMGGNVLWGGCLVIALFGALLYLSVRARVTARQAANEPVETGNVETTISQTH